jgi:QLQ
MSGGFTASQWVELEHQALIFKYLMAGAPVPPDLLLPIRRSFDPLQSPFYHHSSRKFPSSFTYFFSGLAIISLCFYIDWLSGYLNNYTITSLYCLCVGCALYLFY